jgi:hypothetical protein
MCTGRIGSIATGDSTVSVDSSDVLQHVHVPVEFHKDRERKLMIWIRPSPSSLWLRSHENCEWALGSSISACVLSLPNGKFRGSSFDDEITSIQVMVVWN